MKLLGNLVIVLLVIGLYSCNNITVGSKNTLTKKFDIQPFNKISIASGCDAKIEKSSENSVEILINDNFIQYVNVYVENNTLNIKMKEGINYNKKVFKAIIKTPAIEALRLSGGSIGTIKEKFETNNLELGLSGGSILNGLFESERGELHLSGGSISNLKGKISKFSIETSGGSIVESPGLISDDCTVSSSGGSLISLEVNNNLSVSASGGSIITYKGNPAIKTISMSGGSLLEKSNK